MILQAGERYEDGHSSGYDDGWDDAHAEWIVLATQHAQTHKTLTGMVAREEQ